MNEDTWNDSYKWSQDSQKAGPEERPDQPEDDGKVESREFDLNRSVDVATEKITDKLERLRVVVEDIKEPEAKAEATAKLSLAERMTQGVFEKISERLGSNEGGWYEDQETGEKMYVKFYENADQARAEYVANAVYAKLGIRAVDSKLFDFNGRLAIASAEVPGAVGASRGDQKASPDVRDGFVADAYLANWDVVGLVFDNIVKGADGHMHRIDNGGSFIFRAEGRPKEYPSDRIDELESLLIPRRPSGQVFEKMSEEEMRVQARRIFETLTDEVIEEILVQAGFSEQVSATVKKGLLGRRDWLAERFNLVKVEEEASHETARGSDRLAKAMDAFARRDPKNVREPAEKRTYRFRHGETETTLYPRIGLLADGDSIADQQIDVIQSPDETSVRFKFTKKKTREVLDQLAKIFEEQDGDDSPSSMRVERGHISYKNADYSLNLSAAYIIKVDGLELQVSAGVPEWRFLNSLDQGSNPRDESGQHDSIVRVSRGLVRIVGGADIPTAELSKKVNKIVEEILGIQGGLEAPEQDAERRLKESRYRWHHKTDAPPEDVESRLTREEVFPGYYTMIEKDKHREYEAISEFAVYHTLNTGGARSILRLLKARGLMATHERMSRGAFRSGMSTSKDLFTGGADSVFTRTITTAGIKRSAEYDQNFVPGEYVLLMDKRVMDRTDWYAYDDDRYGTTKEGTFTTQRQSPRQLFEEQRDRKYNPANEQMFKRGIAIEDIKHLAVADAADRTRTIRELLDAGVTQINGMPVEKFVVLIQGASDLIDVAYNREPAVIRKEQVYFNRKIEVDYSPYRSSYRMRLLGQDFPTSFKTFVIDVKDRKLTEKLFDEIQEYMGTLDVPDIEDSIRDAQISDFVATIAQRENLTVE